MLLASSFADALEVLQTYGPFCGCLVLAVAFFLWQSHVREGRLVNRVEKLEDETREVLIPMIKNCTDVIATNTVIMERNTAVMERAERKLDSY